MSSRWLMVLRNVLRNWPVTATVITVAVALHIGVSVYPELYPDDASETRRRFGAATTLAIYLKTLPDAPRKPIPQLTGPFDLWDGQLWRVTVSGFHHGNVLHLVMNCLAIASMGWLLEPRMGRLWYAAFLLTATTVSGVPDCLLSNYAIGLSGGAYAMFGLLLVLRKHDPLIADIVPPSFAIIGFGWLFLCMALTAFDLLAIANAAHVAGVIYGLLAGQIFYGRRTVRRRWKLSFFAAHLLLLPAFYLIMHPFWIGSYHWYRARSEENLQSKAALLEQAVTRDPSLEIPWSLLADYYATTGDLHRGWETILRGLDYNRSDERGVLVAQQVWLKFKTPDERWEALEALRKILGDESRDWWHRLRIVPNRVRFAGVPIALDLGLPQPNANKLQNDAERACAALFVGAAGQPMTQQNLSAPAIDPDAPGSAAEGVTF
jgi:membrane associated rhomboid family serine protease